MSQPHFKTGIISKKKGFIKDKVALVVRKESQPFVNGFLVKKKKKSYRNYPLVKCCLKHSFENVIDKN